MHSLTNGTHAGDSLLADATVAVQQHKGRFRYWKRQAQKFRCCHEQAALVRILADNLPCQDRYSWLPEYLLDALHSTSAFLQAER